MAEKTKISEKLEFYRKQLGLTQRELGIKSGVSYTSISDYENGKSFPRRKTLEKLAKALGVDVSEFSMLEIQKEEPEPELSEDKEIKIFKAIFKDLIMDMSVEIPIYSSVPAGKPEEAGGEIVEYIKMPKLIASTVDYALKVKGLSMVEAGIFEGSIVFVKQQKYADDGDIVIARKGNDYTIKRFRKTASESWLEPTNQNFAFGKSEFEIVGVVKHILRSL
jgi:repressor LexA